MGLATALHDADPTVAVERDAFGAAVATDPQQHRAPAIQGGLERGDQRFERIGPLRLAKGGQRLEIELQSAPAKAVAGAGECREIANAFFDPRGVSRIGGCRAYLESDFALSGAQLAAGDRFPGYREVLLFAIGPRTLATIDREDNPALEIGARRIGKFDQSKRIRRKAPAEDLVFELRAFVSCGRTLGSRGCGGTLSASLSHAVRAEPLMLDPGK
jgi:hypothetical protein